MPITLWKQCQSLLNEKQGVEERKIFKNILLGHEVITLSITTRYPNQLPLQHYTKFVFSLATVEKPCVSTSQTILVFGEIPLIQNHDSISSPLLLTMVFNCSALFFFPKRKWSLNESAGHCQGRKWYQSDSFIWLYSLIQPKFITKHQAKDIGPFLNPHGWQFQESLSILFHFINSTRFIDHLSMKQYPC